MTNSRDGDLGRSVLSMAASRARKIRRRFLGQSEGGPGLFSKRGFEWSTEGTYELRPPPGAGPPQRSWMLSGGP